MPRLKILMLASASLALLAACENASGPRMGDSPARTVGVSDYAQYMRAQEELSRIRAEGGAVSASRVNADGQPATIGQEAVAAVRAAASDEVPSDFQLATQQATGAPLSATGDMTTASAETGVSADQFTPQPFGAGQPDQLVERDFVPQVSVSDDEVTGGDSGPNLFAYALSTQHNVGEERYSRTNPLRWRRTDAACARFDSQDLAQEAFLAAGGPERDPNHLDPNGDGFACRWDPTPFRQAAGSARARE